MPLERVVVRNEFGLGKELFKGVSEDPKAVFDGVSVAGLVGLLRQLGDLAEFAAEVFQGLHEEVVTTSLRSRKLVVRVKQIESALPSLEKVALAQKSHLHFCYTAGTDWHANIQNQRNHFIHGDLPKFIMDSYEECREPPRFHMLDRFDSNGPGSCLKKYSDPTFFKKASPISEEQTAGRSEKDTKRLERKKRQGRRNREVQVQNVSISDGIARMQIVSPVGDSPAQCISTYKTSSESEFEDQSQSFELSAGGNYIDCVFDYNPSVKGEEEELMEPQLPQFSLQPYESFNSDYSENHGKVEDDVYHHKSLHYEPSSSSTRVSWEEKTEIVNCKDYGCMPVEATETIINNPHVDILETNTIPCHVNQIYFTSDGTRTDQLNGPPEDIESDTEDFMDALNTIDSETEGDSCFLAKQELEHHILDVNIPGAAHQLSHEPNTLATLNDGTPPSGIPSDNIDPALLNGFMTEELPQPAAENIMDNSVSILNSSHQESTNRDPLPTHVPVTRDMTKLLSEKIVNGVHDSHESLSSSSVKSPVTFWTNGGLLGLQPSKPTDFKVSAGGNQNYKEVETAFSSAKNCPNTTSTGASKSLDTDHNPQNKTTDIQHKELDNAPPMSGLAYKLFSNGFQRKLPSIHDYRSLPIESPRSDCVEQKTVAQKSYTEKLPKLLFNTGFDVNSASSSPPLEHMKISFLPVGAAEASHLKLKFHDEDINHEMYGDMLPSFQLVPDSSVVPCADGTDSDTDTFCRSPDSRSDDNLDYHSESSSGRWESSETIKGNGLDFYEDMCRITAARSDSHHEDHDYILSKCLHPDRGRSHLFENGDIGALANQLPNFDVMKSSVPTTVSGASLKDTLNTAHFLNEATPPPPPLPPSQWMSTKLQSDSHSNQQNFPSKDFLRTPNITGFASLEHQNLLSTWQPTVLQVPTKQNKVQEIVTLLSPNKFQDQQKVFGKAKVNQTAINFDNKDDFLQQIRTQSFNLKRTSLITSTRSNSMPAAPITNAKVSAILEKANAIRQVVASDDGEDDTWSE